MKKVTRESFEELVLGSEKPVVLDFWGPQCVPCVRLEPAVVAIGSSMEGSVSFFKVVAPENRLLCVQLQVMTLPAFLAFKGGEEVGRLSGDDISPDDIKELANSLI